jgi:hypothetical protein
VRDHAGLGHLLRDVAPTGAALHRERHRPAHGRLEQGQPIGHLLAELSAADPVSWFDAEQVTVRALIRQACGVGDDEAAFDLVQRMEKYFDVRGMYTEWDTSSRLALAACREAGNVRGEAVVRRGPADLAVWITEDHGSKAMAAA